MGTAAPAPMVEERSVAAPAVVPEGGNGERALVPTPPIERAKAFELTSSLARVALELDVAVPIRGMRLGDLIALDRGQVIETQWHHEEDLPLAAGKVQLGWTEFEVVDTRLAVRITRLA